MRWLLGSMFLVGVFAAAVPGQVKLELKEQKELEEKFKRVGLTLIVVRASDRTGGGEARLTSADAEAIRQGAGKLLLGVAPIQQGASQTVSRGNSKWRTITAGCTPHLQQVRNWEVAAGRFLTAQDLKKQTAVCLIGQTVRTKLFEKDADPVHESIQVGDLKLQVVGVLKVRGKGLTNADQDDLILIPLSLQQKLVGEERLSAILAVAPSVDQVDQSVQTIRRVLREQRRVKEGAEDFEVSSILELYKRVTGKKGTNKDQQDR